MLPGLKNSEILLFNNENFHLFLGGENVGGGHSGVCHSVATLPGHVGVQQFRHHVLGQHVHGPVVSYVR